MYGSRVYGERNREAYPPYRISSFEGFDFPLLVVSHEPQKKDADPRVLFPPQGLGHDDNRFPLIYLGHQ